VDSTFEGNSTWARAVDARGVGAAGKNTAHRIMTRPQARNSGALKTVIRRPAVRLRTDSSRRSFAVAAALHIVESVGNKYAQDGAPCAFYAAAVWRSVAFHKAS